jgi:branched-chain amino acid transport system substrate-binding protein
MTRAGTFLVGALALASIALASRVVAAPATGAGDSVKIGVLTDMSGPYAMIAGASAIQAAKIAIDEFGGKVLGRPIELVSGDHRNDPDIGVGIARQWFDHDGVDAIVDLTSTPVALAVQQLAKERGRIDIVTGAATPRLTGDACSPTGFHWVYDTYALGQAIGRAVADQGDRTWYFITTEAAFGPSLEQDAAGFITAAGGKVLGSAHHPPGITDFAPYLLQAQASGAQVIALADAGQDAVTLIRQASQFGIGRGGQRLAGLLMTITDVHEIGLELAQGMVVVTASYWDQGPAARVWSRKFLGLTGVMPNMLQAGNYSAVLHYLKAVQAAGTTDGALVARKMRELPVNDAFVANGVVGADGLMRHDMYLAVVKSPGDSRSKWDDLDILETIPADHAFLPIERSLCQFAKK